jgi:hypothetical protein
VRISAFAFVLLLYLPACQGRQRRDEPDEDVEAATIPSPPRPAPERRAVHELRRTGPPPGHAWCGPPGDCNPSGVARSETCRVICGDLVAPHSALCVPMGASATDGRCAWMVAR